MTEQEWMEALPNSAASMTLSALGVRKNKNSCFDLIRWMVGMKLHFRTRDGFTLVRGSDAKNLDGMKENPFLQFLGLTQGKIRGAIKTMLACGIIEIIESRAVVNRAGNAWQINWRKQCRNPPIRYRFTKWLLDAIREGHKADSTSSVEPLSFSKQVTRKAQDSQERLLFPGNLASTPAPAAPAPVRAPVQALSGALAGAIGRFNAMITGRTPTTPVTAAPVAVEVFGPPKPTLFDLTMGRALSLVQNSPTLPVVELKPIDRAVSKSRCLPYADSVAASTAQSGLVGAPRTSVSGLGQPRRRLSAGGS